MHNKKKIKTSFVEHSQDNFISITLLHREYVVEKGGKSALKRNYIVIRCCEYLQKQEDFKYARK